MIFLCLILSSMLSAGNAEFDRTASEGAARITMGRFVRSLRLSGLPSGVLSSEMLKNPESFSSRTAAVERCNSIYLSKTAEAFSNKLENVRRTLSLGSSFEYALSEADMKSLLDKFPAAFERERREAVDQQAKNLVSATRPTEKEFEEKPTEQLKREMAERIVKAQKQAVFEENLQYISEKIVAPVLRSAEDELKRQREYLMRARSDASSPTGLKSELEERLKANVSERSRDVPAEEAWGVFPSVLKDALPKAVERRIVNKMKARMNDVKLNVDVAEVAKIISGDIASHAKYSASEKKFAFIYSCAVLTNALEATLREARESERAELEDFLLRRMGSEDVIKALEKVVRREIMPKWKVARAEIASTAAKKIWPSLDDGTWYPEAYLADEVLSRSDYIKSIRAWREIKGLESLARSSGDKKVMEESLKFADERVKAAFELARSAISAQNKTVDSTHESVLSEVKAKKAVSPVTLNEVISMITDATEKMWSKERVAKLWSDGGAPKNAAEQHVALFPSVKNRIELLARKILEEIKKEELSQAKSETEEKIEGSSDAENETMEFKISVIKTSNQVEVKLLKGESTVLDKQVELKYLPFENAMKEVSRKLGREILSLP
ncbi:MAG: hypothetical protein KIH06_03060 [Kiritimatiellae bacterium]|nr:hypothetical protein [Kiritimatiellia bacterium]